MSVNGGVFVVKSAFTTRYQLWARASVEGRWKVGSVRVPRRVADEWSAERSRNASYAVLPSTAISMPWSTSRPSPGTGGEAINEMERESTEPSAKDRSIR